MITCKFTGWLALGASAFLVFCAPSHAEYAEPPGEEDTDNESVLDDPPISQNPDDSIDTLPFDADLCEAEAATTPTRPAPNNILSSCDGKPKARCEARYQVVKLTCGCNKFCEAYQAASIQLKPGIRCAWNEELQKCYLPLRPDQANKANAACQAQFPNLCKWTGPIPRPAIPEEEAVPEPYVIER